MEWLDLLVKITGVIAFICIIIDFIQKRKK
jgi:hypothetical protein|nr:MAG TPA: hypothetical protein [Caudoviricetes sp.]